MLPPNFGFIRPPIPNNFTIANDRDFQKRLTWRILLNLSISQHFKSNLSAILQTEVRGQLKPINFFLFMLRTFFCFSNIHRHRFFHIKRACYAQVRKEFAHNAKWWC